MKKIEFTSNIVAITAGLWVLFFSLVFNVYGNSWLVSLFGYGSSGDYTNPQPTLSGSVSVSSGQTLTWATQVTLTAPVQLTSGSVQVVIPTGTQITTSSGWAFNATQIVTNTIVSLPVSLPSTEQDVGKIKFWVDNTKLNFTKPVKIQIPVSTSSSTVRIKVKHFGDSGYTTNSLANTLSANCTNGLASPSSDVASVSNGVATIYTCSASDFVAVTNVTPASTSRNSGGGRIYMDVCPKWDFSPSYYDRTCGTKPTTTDESSPVVTQETSVSTKLTTGEKLRYKYVPELHIKSVKYKGYEVKTIDGYTYSKTSKQLSLKIIDSSKFTPSEKQRYVAIVNDYITSRYKYDLSIRQQQLEKNKLNKNTLLMKAVMRKISK